MSYLIQFSRLGTPVPVQSSVLSLFPYAKLLFSCRVRDDILACLYGFEICVLLSGYQSYTLDQNSVWNSVLIKCKRFLPYLLSVVQVRRGDNELFDLRFKDSFKLIDVQCGESWCVTKILSHTVDIFLIVAIHVIFSFVSAFCR